MDVLALIILILVVSLIVLIYIKYYNKEKNINKRNNYSEKKRKRLFITRIVIAILLSLLTPISFNLIKFNLPFVESFYSSGDLVYQMYIESDVDINQIDKEEYKDGSVSIYQDDKLIHDDLKMRIRGRGNSTWTQFEKKPYRIKFDKRQSILGMKSAKDYVILAESADKSLLRNYSAHKLSSYLNVGYAIETRFVEVYYNDEYNGFYLLCEQVEVDKNRLSINTGVLEESGYLMELEFHTRLESTDIEDYNYVVVDEKIYLIKDFDYEDYTEEETRYKAGLIKQDITNLVNSFKDGTYEQYINVESFIDYFILQEIYKGLDVGRMSIYFYKADDGLFYMGPCWDYDLTLGICQTLATPYGLRAEEENTFFNYLMKNDQFRSDYIKRYNEVYNDIIPEFLSHIKEVQKITKQARERNFYKWKVMFTRVFANSFQATVCTSVNMQDVHMSSFLSRRTKWLYKYYN